MKNQQQQNVPKPKNKRGPRSGISYPYCNMEVSVEVARVIHEKGGGSCSPDQLASFLKYSSTRNGTYLSRVSASKLFGFIESGGGIISTTERARAIFAPVMPEEAKKAKIEAFLTIALFQAVHEKFKGTTLPSKSGWKNLLDNTYKIVTDRIGPALRVLFDSAEYAGFFEASGDQTRLIIPVVASESAQQHQPVKSTQSDEFNSGNISYSSGGGDSARQSGAAPSGVHSAITGLLRELPPAGQPWRKSQKERFMQAFTSTIDFIYPDEQENKS